MTNSLLYFQDNILKFDQVDINKDIIEISFILISEKIKRCKPLLLNLKSLEINRSIKKLFEMPDKSIIDITYFINEMNEKNLIIKDEEKINCDEKLVLKKCQSNKIDSNKNNNYVQFNCKKYDTPMIMPRILDNVPEKLDSNNNNQFKNDNINLAQKIFSKIFQKNQIENLNNSIEIINYSDAKDILENNEINKIENKYNTFCLGIFISGLKSPIDISSFIESSKNFISSCSHKYCSNLMSLKPDLLSVYLNKNSKISNEINYLVANLCFPLGIKICFDNLNDKINQKSNRIYYNIIKNEKDEIYYITTLQYFVKMNYKYFKEKYQYDLISYYINQEKKENFLKKISDDSIIYIPESISLLAKYPFFIPMNICLNCIMSLETINEKNYLINHIINEIPAPNRLKQILFYIPLIKNHIILNHRYNIYKNLSLDENSIIKENNINFNINENLSISQFNSKILLEKIPTENIIFLFQLLLLEQQIIIVENNYEILSQIILILINLIYPLNWINPFLPILSLNTVQFLQTPVPYIMGLDECLLKYALNSKSIYIEKEVIIYNISSKSFTLNKNKKKMNKKDIINELKLNFLPAIINKFLETELKKKKILLEKNKINEIELDMNIRLIFIKAMSLLIGDYNNYTFYTNDDNIPLFNKEAFIESQKEKKMKLFLEQMIKTQLFKQFLVNEKQLYLYEKKINNKNEKNEFFLDDNFDINDCVDTSDFKKIWEIYKIFINKNKKRKSSLDLDFNIDEENLDFKIDNNKMKSKFNLKFKLNKKEEENNEMNLNNIFSQKNNNKLLFDFNDLANSHLKLDSLKIFEENKNNNKSNEFNNIIIKKKIKIKKYLLFPYFIKQGEDETSLKYNIINDKIIKYNKKFLDLNKLKNKIYIIPVDKLQFNFSQIDDIKVNHYMIKIIDNIFINDNINDSNENKEKNKINNYIKYKRNIPKSKNILKQLSEENALKDKINYNINSKIFKSFSEESQNQTHITSNQKNLCDFITNIFTKCLTNKSRITNSQFSSLEIIFSEKYFRNYFSDLLYPDISFKQKNQKKQLTSFSFTDLVDLIKICFSKIKEDEYLIGIRLTLACFSFYKIDIEKKYFIFKEIIKDKISYKIWNCDNFWMEFFKIEMKEAKNIEERNLNLNDDKSIIEIKSKLSILMDISIYLSKIMVKLNLDHDFIYKVISKIILPIYESDYDNINLIMQKIKNMTDSTKYK